MKVAIFGATGMVGQGVLRECLLAPDVETVMTVGRTPTGQGDAKLRELVHRDFGDFSAIAGELAGVDACFFCLGVSAVGLSEAEYRRITFDFTLAAARGLASGPADATFIYVSGAGTGSGRMMWSRVKSETEQAVLALPLRAYMFRPGFIRPLHGITPRSRVYRVAYRVMAPLGGVFERRFPNLSTTTEKVGRAMLNAARHGAPKQILETPDINALA